MDQVKIGKYIAEKRKSLEMTQVQLAEQLGMSDKSVSKWERGVCLPDVSVYKPLCAALGISVNEFLAGEDIPEEIVVSKSENTVIQIIKDHTVDKKKMKRIIAILTAAVLVVSSLMLYMLIKDGKFMLNYITPLPADRPEIAVAEMIAGSDVYLYEYNVESKYNHVIVRAHIYEKGNLINTKTISDSTFYDAYNGKGLLAISLDGNTNTAKTIMSSYGGSTSQETELLKDFPGEWFAQSTNVPDYETRIDVSEEVGILMAAFDLDGLMSSISVDVAEDGWWPKGKMHVDGLENNDYTFFFTVEFGTMDYPEEVTHDEEGI